MLTWLHIYMQLRQLANELSIIFLLMSHTKARVISKADIVLTAIIEPGLATYVIAIVPSSHKRECMTTFGLLGFDISKRIVCGFVQFCFI